MKNSLITTALILLVIAQSLASNEPKSAILTVSTSEKSVILDIADIASETESLTIIDSKGDVIFQDEIEEGKQRIKYDLLSLVDNSYTIKIRGEEYKDEYRMIVNEDALSIESFDSYYRPTVSNEDSKIMIKGLFTSAEDVRLTIFNESNEIVFKYQENAKNNYSQVFNLTQLEEGNYNVIVSTDHFSESISVSL